MKSNELRLQLLDYYERNGIDLANAPSGSGLRDRQGCHWPMPKCLGGTEIIWLLKEGHVLMDLLVSEELQHRCFHNTPTLHVLKSLPEELDSEVFEMFWHLYEKWNGEGVAGTKFYKHPRSEQVKRFKPAEVPDGWVEYGLHNGTRCYKHRESGEMRRLTAEEATDDWEPWQNSTGKSLYLNTETGVRTWLSADEATSEWVKQGQAPGLKTTITCECCGMKNNPGNHARHIRKCSTSQAAHLA